MDRLFPLGFFRELPTDGRLLFLTRLLRLFAYGFISVILFLYLTSIGLSEWESGSLFSLALLGDTAISLWLTTTADRAGRRRMLIAGALLMVLAGLVFSATDNYWLLLAAAAIGVISPSGNEIGPFLSIEQAALSQLVPDESRTRVFAWYNLAGSVATACGSLFGGLVSQLAQALGLEGAASYRPLVIAYGLVGLVLACIFVSLSPKTEAVKPDVRTNVRTRFGLHKSRRVVLRLSALFALDAFAGGFVLQSIVAYWFFVRFQISGGTIGAIFFGANLLAGVSALSAAALARRFGLVNTMVFTHLPSNVLLILVPLMPTAWLAVAVLLLRFSISQMDVPARQSYTMALVSADERSAAAGVSGVARSIGASLSPSLAGLFLASSAFLSAPFFLSGVIKIAYDLLLYRGFRRIRETA
jgi:MFS family permease